MLYFHFNFEKGAVVDKRARYIEKRNFVLHWLLEFQISTPTIICQAMNLNRVGQGRFFLSLKNTGLFTFFKNPLISGEVIILSFEGKKYSAMLSQKSEYYTATTSRVVSSTTVHNLCVQSAIINRKLSSLPFAFKYERFLMKIDKNKRPDAIYDNKGELVALEVELTQKNSKRIYLAFLEHVALMKEGLYNKVEYVFPTESLCEIYKKRFLQPTWPYFFRDNHGKIKPRLDGGTQLMAEVESDAIRSRFIFTHENLYKG